jgi:segregation and condensation protein A
VVQVGLFELIDAFQKILERMAPDHRVDMTTERITVKDRINELVELLEQRGSATFEELFAGATHRSEIIVTFLAILEMVKLQLIRMAQHMQTGAIRLFYQ